MDVISSQFEEPIVSLVERGHPEPLEKSCVATRPLPTRRCESAPRIAWAAALDARRYYSPDFFQLEIEKMWPRVAGYQEVRIRHYHKTLDGYLFGRAGEDHSLFG